MERKHPVFEPDVRLIFNPEHAAISVHSFFTSTPTTIEVSFSAKSIVSKDINQSKKRMNKTNSISRMILAIKHLYTDKVLCQHFFMWWYTLGGAVVGTLVFFETIQMTKTESKEDFGHYFFMWLGFLFIGVFCWPFMVFYYIISIIFEV